MSLTRYCLWVAGHFWRLGVKLVRVAFSAIVLVCVLSACEEQRPLPMETAVLLSAKTRAASWGETIYTMRFPCGHGIFTVSGQAMMEEVIFNTTPEGATVNVNYVKLASGGIQHWVRR